MYRVILAVVVVVVLGTNNNNYNTCQGFLLLPLVRSSSSSSRTMIQQIQPRRDRISRIATATETASADNDRDDTKSIDDSHMMLEEVDVAIIGAGLGGT